MRYTTRPCKHCGKDTTNPNFCSRSCSTSANNLKNPRKPRKDAFCAVCQKKIKYRKNTTRCMKCRLSNLVSPEVSAYIRNFARICYRKSDKPKQCHRCAYNKHYEVAHIKPIKDFAPITKLCEVNHIDNLVALCPNCHWELDNGLWHWNS